MIIFGGAGGSAALNDVWTLSLGASPAWTPLTPTGTPPSGRYFASAVYDAKRDRMLVFAGRFSFNYSNEVWALTLSGTPAWTLLTPSGTPPSARASQVAIYDPIRDRMLMYGGSNSSGPLTDLWALNLASGPAWNALTTAGSQGETGGYSAIYDLARDRVLLFGGYDAFGNDYNYVAALSLTGTPTWTSLSPLGVPPSPRANSPTVYDKNVDRMIVFGGASGDVWSLTWGTPLSVPDPDATVERFALAALSPNPFRGRVAIAFDVPRASWLQLRVFDLQGREVKRIADAQFAPGRYAREWDGRNESGALEPAGIYFIGLSSRGVSVTRKAVLIR
jgi:hypothetical protein